MSRSSVTMITPRASIWRPRFIRRRSSPPNTRASPSPIRLDSPCACARPPSLASRTPSGSWPWKSPTNSQTPSGTSRASIGLRESDTKLSSGYCCCCTRPVDPPAAFTIFDQCIVCGCRERVVVPRLVVSRDDNNLAGVSRGHLCHVLCSPPAFEDADKLGIDRFAPLAGKRRKGKRQFPPGKAGATIRQERPGDVDGPRSHALEEQRIVGEPFVGFCMPSHGGPQFW